MRSPILSIASNLMWTRNGTVWAMWRLHPVPYGYRPTKDKAEARMWHRAMIQALPGESLLLGVCAGMDPAAVVERMIDGIDLEACPDWAAECEATLDTLDGIGIGQRVFWLAKPLPNSGTNALTTAWATQWADFKDRCGLPRPGIPEAEVTRRAKQAQQVADALPSKFRPTPASPAQMVWLHLHAQQRGLFADMALPEEPGDLAEQMLTPRSGVALGEPLLDEGGQSDLDRRALRSWNPLERRYLKVTQPHVVDDVEASYQSLMVLTDVPAEGMRFPGSEFLGRIDEAGIEVDWALRLQVRSSDQVAAENRRALRNLNEQYKQREGEESPSGQSSLDRAAGDLAEYAQILDDDKLEVEAQATVIFATAGPDPDTANNQARDLSDYFKAAGYKLAQPLGNQEDLWWAMIPGTPATRTIREFAQITTSKALSATVPISSTDLGTAAGSLIALNISTGRPGTVLHDIAGVTLNDGSASIGIAGELGAGKSVLMKSLCGSVVDRGGQIVVPDRTSMGEWAHWAAAVTESVVVNIADPQVSLDPLRMYGPAEGARITQSFLTTLLHIAPRSDAGATLSEVLDPPYLQRHGLTGLGDVLAHLQAETCTVPGGHDLARKMNVFARKDLGRAVFDNSLPPLQATAPAVIIRTHTLELPNAEELLTPQLFEQLSIEKIFGRAYYTLIGFLARQICFADRSRLGVFPVDECHHLTGSPEGERAIKDFVRDGRKHMAAVILGSHDPEADFGSETTRGLIPTRIQMRQTDKNLARKGLRWLDMDPDDEELLDRLMNDTSPQGPDGVPEDRRGEAFMRDSQRRIGRIKVLAPSLPSRNEAVRTSPTTVAADKG